LVGNTNSTIEYQPAVQDDPQQRRPDISLAAKVLKWEPIVPLDIGLEKTINFFRKEIQRSKHTERNIFNPHDLLPDEQVLRKRK